MLNYKTYDYKDAVHQLEASFDGDLPAELVNDRPEVLRAAYILTQHRDEPNPVKLLRRYMVAERVIRLCLADGAIEVERTVKRVDKYRAIVAWCNDHVYEQVTPNQLAEVGGVSYPTALKFINDRVDLFRRVKRGVYEVRDVQAERANK